MIHLARHGQTEFNRDNRLQGRIDSPLTDLGRRQAARVGDWLAGQNPQVWRIVSSPLGRAAETARIIAAGAGLSGQVILDERLMELSIGSWEGLARSEIERLRPDLAGQPFFMHCPDGEPWDTAAARLSSFVADYEAGAGHLLAVSHAGAGKVLRAAYLGLSLAEARHLDTPQDALYRLSDGAALRIDCL